MALISIPALDAVVLQGMAFRINTRVVNWAQSNCTGFSNQSPAQVVWFLVLVLALCAQSEANPVQVNQTGRK
jgi:hypothetical protein